MDLLESSNKRQVHRHCHVSHKRVSYTGVRANIRG